MKDFTGELFSRIQRPIKVLQFGEGNFLRGFADYMIDIANEKGVFDGNIVIVKPIPYGSLDNFHKQNCFYHVSLQGFIDGKPQITNRTITSVSDVCDCYADFDQFRDLAKLPDLRFIISNTTEAGITFDDKDSMDSCPPATFPGKLTLFLYERYKNFHGASDKGVIMLPVELIDDNGIALKECVIKYIRLWQLEDAFFHWVHNSCIFTSTLVDRIITGYPVAKEEEEWKKLGCQDRLLVTGEPFALWVIESKVDISKEFPLDQAGLPVLFTKDQKPYKQRKVRILNGAHTSFVLASYLCGNDIVRTSMEDADIYRFMVETLFQEVIPTLSLPKEELEQFTRDVILRFQNPYVDHSLLAISLNSVSKWKTRCLPSLLDYQEQQGHLPSHLTFSLAALAAFYHSNRWQDDFLLGNRNGEDYKILDDYHVLSFFSEHYEEKARDFIYRFLSQDSFWGLDLTTIPGFTDAVCEYYTDILTSGMRTALCKLIKK